MLTSDVVFEKICFRS